MHHLHSFKLFLYFSFEFTMSCHSTFAQNKNSETKEHIKKIYWTPFLFILKSCSNKKQLFCNVSKTNGIQRLKAHSLSSVIESEQHVINNQTLSDHWCFETIMHHKITPKAWEKNALSVFYPLSNFIFRLAFLSKV